MTITIFTGCCLSLLATLPDKSIHTCVTSPPYWGLRDYGQAGQLGLEATPAEFVANMVAVFNEVRRVLRDDGTLWLNLGDSYANGGCGARDQSRWPKQSRNDHMPTHAKKLTGLKPKDLVGIPWRVAFALQADGWYLRSDIIWSKPNPMPESVTDRPTKSHEYVFLLSKSEKYYYDHGAIAEPVAGKTGGTLQAVAKRSGNKERKPGAERGCPEGTGSNVCGSVPWEGTTRNKRSVWNVATKPFSDAHFATYPPELIEPCILAGSPVGGIVLDPFFGAGTTGLVADRLNRHAIGCELNPEYVEIARKRLTKEAGMFAEVVVAA